jgi:hypothetical protein
MIGSYPDHVCGPTWLGTTFPGAIRHTRGPTFCTPVRPHEIGSFENRARRKIPRRRPTSEARFFGDKLRTRHRRPQPRAADPIVSPGKLHAKSLAATGVLALPAIGRVPREEDQPSAEFIPAESPQLLWQASQRPIHFFTVGVNRVRL